MRLTHPMFAEASRVRLEMQTQLPRWASRWRPPMLNRPRGLPRRPTRKAPTTFAALPVGKYDLTVEAVGLTLYRQSGIEVAADRSTAVNIAMTAAGGSQVADNERQALMERIATLEQRITDLESSTVLSEPETRVRRVEVYVDNNGTVYEEPVAGATPQVTYERERVYRRQTINEKLEEALEDAANRNVRVGVDAAFGTQIGWANEGQPVACLTGTRMHSPRRTFSSRRGSRSTPCSLQTSSD